MKITVLNGSPKGKYSITLQYVNFIQKKFPQHEFKIFHVSQHIKKLEKDEKSFQEIIEAIKSSDGVLWSFGLFVLAVPAQLMRFVELISEREMEDVFKNKYAAVISTSIHYYDHTAHNYMRAVCEDLNMKYAEGISLDILDMMKKSECENTITFAENFFETIEKQRPTSNLFKALTFNDFNYQPTNSNTKIDSQNKKVLILTDSNDSDTNLGKMINKFQQSFVDEPEVINLNDIEIRGACLGCMKCGYEYQCQYSDGFRDFYNNRVRSADIIVFAGSVNGRYLSSKWKIFYDRAFFWNHTPSLIGKQMAYIISGPLAQNHNLLQILEASVTERQESNLVDIIIDESENSAEIDSQLQSLAERLIHLSVKGYIKPQNFLSVGGHKIFRDNVWGRLRPLWQADHRFYKKNGWYDFPQRDIKIRIMTPVMMIVTKIPFVRKKYYDNIMKFPAQRYGKFIEKITQS